MKNAKDLPSLGMSIYANEVAYQGHPFFSLSGKAKVLTGDCSVNDLCKASLSLVIKDEEQ